MSSDHPSNIVITNTNEAFIFNKENQQSVVYDKKQNTFKNEENTSYADSDSYNVNCVLGLIEAEKQGYLVAARNVVKVGEILKSNIYKISELVFIPKESRKIVEEDIVYLEMIKDSVNKNNLLYSDTMDLTLSILSYKSREYPSARMPTKTKFCWNCNMAKNLDSPFMEEFMFPIINGFYADCKVEDYDKNLKYILIGRKDTRRCGVRFLQRGANEQGNCTNFVETEEIFILTKDGNISINSFISIRGSIPMIWTQEPNFQLNPTIVPLNKFNEQTKVFDLHMNELVEEYGNVICVNLIDKKGDQKNIGEYYQSLCNRYKENKPDVLEYVWFDFHAECKHLKYENMSKLFDMSAISNAFNNFDYTEVELMDCPSTTMQYICKEEFKKTQKGTFRVNCVDCLDRCNVVQCALLRHFAHYILHQKQMEEAPTNEALQKFKPGFEKNFKYIWADHGDALSVSYSGTNALKATYTRTGKATKLGTLIDGYLSCKRFFINNFRDGYNQDCFDYFLGNINPRKIKFREHNNTFLKYFLPIGFALSSLCYNILTGLSLSKLPEGQTDGIHRKSFKFVLLTCSFIVGYFLVMKTMKNKIIDYQTLHK